MAALVLLLVLLLAGVLWFTFRHRPGRRGAADSARSSWRGATDLAALLASEDEPEARRRLERALLDASLVVPARPRPAVAPGPPSPDDASAGEDARGGASVPGSEGALELGHVRLGERLYVPVFTREEHLDEAMEPGAGSMVLDGRTLFSLVPRDTPVVVDPGFPTERRLPLQTVARLSRAAGGASGSPELEPLTEDDAVFAGALEACLERHGRVHRAHLARIGGDDGSRLVVGLEVDGDLQALVRELVEEVRETLPAHGAVDFRSLEPGPLTDLLLSTEPLVGRRISP